MTRLTIKNSVFALCQKKELEEAEFSYESMYGRSVSGWKRDKDRIRYHIEVPVNTRAEVFLKGKTFLETPETYRETETGYCLELGAGEYYFTVTES